jgi:hypothetical protein
VSYKSSIDMMLSLAWVSVGSVCLPSIVMRVERGEVRCCALSKVWNGGDGWNPLGDVVCHARIC